MEKNDAKRLIGRIFTFYGRKPPEPQQVDMISDKLRDVPGTSEIIEYLYQQFTDNEDSPLGNLPKKIKGYWFNWQSGNRQRIEIERTDCKACNGFGVIPHKRERFGLIYEEVVVCGECENWRNEFAQNHGIPVMTRSAIISKGWKLLDQATGSAPRPVEVLVQSVGVPF